MHQSHYPVQDADSRSKCITSLDDDDGTADADGSYGAGARERPPANAERYPPPTAHGSSPWNTNYSASSNWQLE
ncbi:hypothetical protein FIE12Z_12369 [Fusarium flagelliforme]|uniref:Uncharacterized protein n=1 Tax=Fusarium flagelliforme TaxID=2675880 RepID=A0A395M6A0_9HYPO|nr:hypothetical protein FIE12Z_12369 [Fusarium flagelliforme]